LRAELPDDNGGTKTTYMEVKTVSGLSQWYHPARRREQNPVRGTRAVERRELTIVKEYEKAAKDNDQKYFKTDNGPITQRLGQIGPIFPAPFVRYGETGDQVHKLVAVMANARVARQNIAWGRGEDIEKPCLSMETAYIRQRLSSAIVTCFGHRLVSRMSQEGNGAVSAADRRQQWGREEQQARVMRNAAWLATVSGQDIVRRGRFWTS
jgi:hypothetical protein